MPIKRQELLWTSLFTFIITLVTVKTVNFIYKKYDYFSWRKPVEKAVDDFGDEIEQLFKQSLTDKLLIRITLKNNKVYVGFTDKILPPQETNYLKIVPVMSGFRNSETKEVTFNTEYYHALDYYSKHSEKNVNFDMDIILKQDEILTAGIFDQDIYEKFSGKI